MPALRPVLVTALALVVGLGLVGAPVVASAREPNSKALRFDKLGKTAYGKKDWDEAIAAFEAAYQFDAIPKFLYNTARAYEKKNDYRKAIEYLEKYLAVVTDPKAREDASDRLSILQIKLRKTRSPLKITAPPDALITAKGAQETLQAKGTLSSWLPFGAYEVSVKLDGFSDHTRTVVVRADDNAQIDIALDKIVDEKPPPPPVAKEADKTVDPLADEAGAPPVVAKTEPKEEPPPPPAPPTEVEAGGPPAWLAYTLMGVGGLALVGGVAAGVFSNDANANIESLASRSKRGEAVDFNELKAQIAARDDNALAANVLYGVGAVALGAGAVLWVMVPDDAVAFPTVTLTTDAGVLTWSESF